jgi:hypothetical protein
VPFSSFLLSPPVSSLVPLSKTSLYLPLSSLSLSSPSPSPDIDYILMQSLLNWHQDLPHHMPHHVTTREDDALTARVQAFPLLSLIQVMVAARLVKDYNENRHVWGKEEGGGGKRRGKRRREEEEEEEEEETYKIILWFLVGLIVFLFSLIFHLSSFLDFSPPQFLSSLIFAIF